MAGRFAPPPDVQANTRRRLLVLRTSMARCFAPSPYAGTDVPRHHPPPATSLFVSATATTALHASKATSSFCKRRYALVQLRTAHCLLRLIHVCRSQKRPCSGMFASYAHRYLSRIRSTLQARLNPSCTIHVLLMFVICSLRLQSISSHGTLYSEVSNAHLCRKLAQPDWLILEVIALGLAVNAILA